MAADLNSVHLIGRLAADPEVRPMPGGDSVCELRLAVNNRKKTGDEWADEGHFFNVTVFGKQGENVTKYAGKGDRVAVSGRLQQRRWEAQDGTKRERVNVVANSVQFLQPKAETPKRSEPDHSADETVPF